MRHYAGRLALAMALALAGYLLIYRPLQLRWGATHEEVMRAMPGDTIQQTPIFNATRAITIDARPEEIWPWLMQSDIGGEVGTVTTASTTTVVPALCRCSRSGST